MQKQIKIWQNQIDHLIKAIRVKEALTQTQGEFIADMLEKISNEMIKWNSTKNEEVNAEVKFVKLSELETKRIINCLETSRNLIVDTSDKSLDENDECGEITYLIEMLAIKLLTL